MKCMAYDFSRIKNRGEEIKEWFKKECAVLRTGRATPTIVENLQVDSYGAKVPLKQIASIGIEDARTIRITPWDTSALKNIEHAIAVSNLGAQPISDKESVRVRLPELTEERRKSLVKILNEKLEEAKISLRQERDEIWKNIQEKERDNEISEDDKYKFKDDLQEIIEKT
ncbi:MAG TPA: ribosome recycling factor, partial [Candidatus Campbellbacteria bacterium]|nr:ribosome recycling factor [Candidatus Campbellbacteria bacterium]